MCASMASTFAFRLQFGLEAHLGLSMEHFDITAAFLYEAFGYNKSVYVQEMRRANGYYLHGKTTSVLHGKMYGARSAANYFLKALISRLEKKGYSPMDFDPCLYYNRKDQDFILFSIYVDDFLVVITRETMIDSLFTDLREKYYIKRLGLP